MNVFLAFKRITDFKGRSRRKEFGYFILFNILLFITMLLVATPFRNNEIAMGIYGLLLIVQLFVFVLVLVPLSIRRLHDTNRAGYYIFLNLIPVLGNFAFLMMLISKSQAVSNKYGDDPKEGYKEINLIGQ